MRKYKIYLDTSIVNFIYAEDSPDYQKITIDFFDNYLYDYDVYISDIVIIEIEKTQNEDHKKKLYEIIDKYNLEIYNDITEEINDLAEMYIKENIIPENKKEDALHVAFSTIYEFDVLLSWNFRHLANLKKQIIINALNKMEGFTKELLLLNPLELIYEKWI